MIGCTIRVRARPAQSATNHPQRGSRTGAQRGGQRQQRDGRGECRRIGRPEADRVQPEDTAGSQRLEPPQHQHEQQGPERGPPVVGDLDHEQPQRHHQQDHVRDGGQREHGDGAQPGDVTEQTEGDGVGRVVGMGGGGPHQRMGGVDGSGDELAHHRHVLPHVGRPLTVGGLDGDADHGDRRQDQVAVPVQPAAGRRPRPAPAPGRSGRLRMLRPPRARHCLPQPRRLRSMANRTRPALLDQPAARASTASEASSRSRRGSSNRRTSR